MRLLRLTFIYNLTAFIKTNDLFVPSHNKIKKSHENIKIYIKLSNLYHIQMENGSTLYKYIGMFFFLIFVEW